MPEVSAGKSEIETRGLWSGIAMAVCINVDGTKMCFCKSRSSRRRLRPGRGRIVAQQCASTGCYKSNHIVVDILCRFAGLTPTLACG